MQIAFGNGIPPRAFENAMLTLQFHKPMGSISRRCHLTLQPPALCKRQGTTLFHHLQIQISRGW